ncbi:MFS transporter [Pelagicoccus sp. SDUM812002]|uniref:MFS transporter n=1 Tax=Pelagicoccus sp. SDUM812002 TaxID=3041266 RepID=UPI00280C5E1A|nr:MFS transporter [Pelagicoccus sp. SDUM812002]MDQ8186995.1 MFS transporter [Pelagicoccus sp. SDUM812002]
MNFDSLKSLPANVWILAASQSLAMSMVPMMILVSSLLAAKIAPDESWVTLPIALVVVGTASSTIPVAFVMKRWGRKKGGFVGFSFGLLACLLGFLAARSASFPFLLGSSYCMGVASAFGQQFRFAALESVKDPANYGPALSAFMTGGLVAAYLGPEIGASGRDLFASPHGFAGSFALLSGVLVLAIVLFSFFKEPERRFETSLVADRSLRNIVKSPAFLIAVSAAALSYAVMSFIMTATPITMHEVCGFSLSDTKRVIQGHIIAMFLPSLFSGWLMKRFGPGKLMLSGTIAYAIVLVIGLQGQELVHFWAALILLGVGWNFLFASGTALLPMAYQGNERYKAQAANDFTVFGCQAVVALSAGWFLYSFGWPVLLMSCLPLVLVAGVVSVIQIRRS